MPGCQGPLRYLLGAGGPNMASARYGCFFTVLFGGRLGAATTSLCQCFPLISTGEAFEYIGGGVWGVLQMVSAGRWVLIFEVAPGQLCSTCSSGCRSVWCWRMSRHAEVG
jgi:hypothetical protein